MLALILGLILIWVVLGIIGFVVKGLLWLFIIACVLFVATLFISTFRHGRRSRARAR